MFVGVGRQRQEFIEIGLAFVQVGVDEKGMAGKMRGQSRCFAVSMLNIGIGNMIELDRSHEWKDAPDFEQPGVAEGADEKIVRACRFAGDLFRVEVMQLLY